MKVSKVNIEGLLLIETDFFFGDDRGYFYESYNKQKYDKIGINFDFVQDNISKSVKETIRGLHYQVGDKAQLKTHLHYLFIRSFRISSLFMLLKK